MSGLTGRQVEGLLQPLCHGVDEDNVGREEVQDDEGLRGLHGGPRHRPQDVARHPGPHHPVPDGGNGQVHQQES